MSARGGVPAVSTEPRAPARHVLVTNLHSTRNVGDAVLLEEAVRQLRAAFPEALITLAMNEPDYEPTDARVRVLPSLVAHARAYGRGSGDRWRLWPLARGLAESLLARLWHGPMRRRSPLPGAANAALLQAYADADLVVSCPGNVLFTMGRIGLPFLLSALAMGYALGFGKPLYVMPQTVGPLRRRHEGALVRRLLGRARLVFVREPTSQALLRTLGLVEPQVRLVPDVAFAYLLATPPGAGDVLARYGIETSGPLLGVTVINRILRRIPSGAWAAYEETIAQAVSGFLSTYGGTAVFLPQVTGPSLKEDDREAARRIVGRMRACRDRAIVVDEVLPPDELRQAYGQMDVFLATRMHSAIFALSAGVPTLAVEYLAKTEGMMAMAGMQEWVLRLERLTPVTVGERLAVLYAQRSPVRAQLLRTVPQLAAASASVGAAIAEDYYSR